MAVNEDKLRATPLVIAATCFFALAISVHFIKQFMASSRRKRPCYLISESKPQLKFKRVLADNSYSQFKHLKLHAADSITEGIICVFLCVCVLALFALLVLNYLLLLIDEYSDLHPYKGEISKLMKNPNVGILELFDGCEKWSLEMGGSYVWVEDEAQLRELVEVLSNEKMFSVDTEQHSLSSFLGFTALIQVHVCISTRKFPPFGCSSRFIH